MTPPESAPVRALIVGLGSIGVRHLENLRALGCTDLGVFRTRGRYA